MEVKRQYSIYPTHTCFDDSLDFIVQVLIHNPDDREYLIASLRLVHGICAPRCVYPYAHAWVEHEELCIFRGILRGEYQYFATPHVEYYATMCVQETTKYTVHEARTLNRRFNTYGPWIDKYIACCRNRQG